MAQPQETTHDPAGATSFRTRYQGVARWINRQPAFRAFGAAQRTVVFTAQSAIRRIRGSAQGIPVPALSPGFVLQAAMDETLLALAMGPNR